MRLAVKTVEGLLFYVHPEPEASVTQLKALVAGAESKFAANLQKLIYQGKILDDSRSLASYNMKDGEFVVCMIPKKPQSRRQVPGMPEDEDGQEVEEDEEEEEGIEQAEIAIDPATVETLVAITGRSEAQVHRALLATFGNADAAADMLMNGGVAMEAAGPPAAVEPTSAFTTTSGGGQSASGVAQPPPASPGLMSMNLIPPCLQQSPPQQPRPPVPPSTVSSELEQFRHHPQFNQLRMLVQSNPDLLQSVISQIGAQNPQMLQVIQANPDAFLALLNEPIGADGSTPPATGAPRVSGPDQGVTLTQQESESIARLESLGFNRQMVLEAFLACERNEEMAANFLFDSMN